MDHRSITRLACAGLLALAGVAQISAHAAQPMWKPDRPVELVAEVVARTLVGTACRWVGREFAGAGMAFATG